MIDIFKQSYEKLDVGKRVMINMAFVYSCINGII